MPGTAVVRSCALYVRVSDGSRCLEIWLFVVGSILDLGLGGDAGDKWAGGTLMTITSEGDTVERGRMAK